MQREDTGGRSHKRCDADSHRDVGDGKERKHRSRDEPESKDSSHHDRDRERKDKHRTQDEVCSVLDVVFWIEYMLYCMWVFLCRRQMCYCFSFSCDIYFLLSS